MEVRQHRPETGVEDVRGLTMSLPPVCRRAAARLSCRHGHFTYLFTKPILVRILSRVAALISRITIGNSMKPPDAAPNRHVQKQGFGARNRSDYPPTGKGTCGSDLQAC